MTAREILIKARQAKTELEGLQLQLDQLKALAGPAVAAYGSERVTGSGLPHSKVEAYTERLEALETMYGDRVGEWLDYQQQAQRIIDRLKKPRHQEVLRLRYQCGMGWEQVREMMGYVELRSVYRIHGWALAEAEKVLSAI